MGTLFFCILTLLTFSSTFPCLTFSFPTDILSQQSPRQGCIWSTSSEIQNGSSDTTKNSPTIFSLNCNLRTLNSDFWNYTFNRNQVDSTTKVGIKCSDKLFFESFLTPNQSLFRLLNLRKISIESCKIRKFPGRIWQALGFLKSLAISTRNSEWSNSIGLELEAASFEGLVQLETLDLSENNIWSFPNRNLFCPLVSLLKLNLSRNRLSDIEDAMGGGGGGCNSLPLQSLDLSFNKIRKIGNNGFSSMRKLSELRLQNNLLEELENSAFAGMGQMKVVNLSSNRLVALPPTIFRNNPNLQQINLSNNSISALSPQVFFSLEYLLSLDLSRNTLTSNWIKENMFSGLVRLVILRLSLNQLSTIDSTIFKDLISLQALYLDGNRIENIHPTAFNSLSNLHVLDLSRNRLSHIDSRAFSNLIVLRQLYLDHNKIKGMEEDALRNCTSLQDLGLADNLLQEVPTPLRAGLSHLVTLDIGENRIAQVSNNSFSGLGQLYGLRIVDNRLTEIPQGFCDSLKSLRVLNVAQNRISKISSTAFMSCPELRALRLDTNALEELPPTLAPQLPSLLWLNVSENQLKWADYHILPPTIEWLDLSYNLIETLGGPVTSVQGQKSFFLRVLDASHNQLSTLDYTTIPPTLETLRVNYNRLKNVAPDTFIRSTRLRRVELIGNELEALPLNSIRFPQVAVGKPLPEFYLGGNNFSCSCENEYLTRINQLTVLRTHPRIVDLDAISCRPTFSRPNQPIPLVETRPKDFLCPYKSHCFALCHCCEFDFCDCQMKCPDNCTCYHDTAWSANIVECSNQNFEQVPPRIPMDASEIYLDGNNMSQLGSHIFIGKKNLRVLFLNDSKIEYIRNKTFNGLKSLEILRLEDNLLSELNGYEFADLENLREVYLQNNLLRVISKETFIQLKFLQVLRLDGNLLIDFHVWELSTNGYLNSVMLGANPWTCDCEFLIPFRTWIASKSSIVVDLTLANCQTVNGSSVGIDSSGSSSFGSGGSSKKLYPIQVQHPIVSMCNHNPELNFNFNPIPSESEILNNHISAMQEKVFHPTSASGEIQFAPVDSSSTFWSLLLCLTAMALLVGVIVAIFRKEIYYWITHKKGGRGWGSPLLRLLCPCNREDGEGGRRRSGKRSFEGDESDKLFDAYFIYSKKDEDILLQKIAPELESQGGGVHPHYRLCLHYRDLCLNPDNPWSTDMILSACDAAKRVVLVLSRTFLQSELTHPGFQQGIQSAINRHQKKLILILLPPFNEQNLSTIYPELKNSKSSTLEWSDKNFWSKLKLILPTPSASQSSCTFSSAGAARGSTLLISPGPLIDLQQGLLGGTNSSTTNAPSFPSYTLNRRDFPYNSQNQYHRNILPYQIPNGGGSNTLVHTHKNYNPASAAASYYQQSQHNYSLYNGSQNSGSQQYYHQAMGNNNLQNFIPTVSHGGGGLVYPMTTLPSQTNCPNFPFNESFRRHLHQSNHGLAATSAPVQFAKQPQGGYQQLETNYSSAISSSGEDHVYSILDSPLQSPLNTTSTTTASGETQGSESANVDSRCNSNRNGKEKDGQQGGQMYFV